MAKKMLVSFPSYTFMLLDAPTLEKVLNATRYEYDWERRVYWHSDSESTEIRVADTDQLMDTRKPIKEEQDNG